MTTPDWARVSAIFAEALELEPGAREAFLADRCAGDPVLRAAVDRLLAADAEAGPAFLATPDSHLLDAVARDLSRHPERLGPWRLVRELGEGGMGQVFLAERADGEFEQQVAVKLLKRGMDSDAVLARFLRERRILAALDHPNIARLFDGGMADDGRPYFVMEYVDGDPVTRFADRRRLPVEDRLVLFMDVCRAVEHAHRNLVVHRDLKPSNILITDAGHPKLLDFGIAKLLSSTGANSTAPHTETGFRLLTPAYAAPEQFLGHAITTSTDVYGLGAVLYELLAGRRPFEHAGAPMAEERRDPGAEPPTLTATLSGASAAAVAEARAADPPRLRRRLAGDLETIVAAALRAAPERRYASVGAFREDLQRHLDGLPVRARPDTAGYRLSRFVRRHRAAVVVAIIVAALVAGFGLVSSMQARAVARERDRAQAEALAARQVSDFLVGIFAVADPMRGGAGDTVRAATLLERGADRVAQDLAGQPALQARMLGVIGRAYDNLSRSDEGERLLAEAVALQRTLPAGDGGALLGSLEALGEARRHRGDHAGAAAALEEALALQAGGMGNGSARLTLLLALADVVHDGGNLDSAGVLVLEALAIFDSLPPGSQADEPAVVRRMTSALAYTRDTVAMDRMYARLVEVESGASGAGGEAVALALTEWGDARQRRGDLAGADSLLSAAANVHARLGSRSVNTAWTLTTLAAVAQARGDTPRADSLLREALAVYRERLGNDHRLVAVAEGALARHLHRTGRPREAIPHYRAAIEGHGRSPDDESYAPLVSWRLGEALLEIGETAAGVATLAEALAGLEARYPPGYLLTAQVRRDFGRALLQSGQPGRAAPQLERAAADLAARWGASDPRVDSVRILAVEARTRSRSGP